MTDEIENKEKEAEKPKKVEPEKVVADHRSEDARKYLIGAVFGVLIVGAVLLSGAIVLRLENRGFVREVRGVNLNVNAPRGNFGNGLGMMRFSNGLSGSVTAVNGSSFTLSTNGQTKTVQISSTTRFPLSSATAVKVGDTVEVVGQQDSSGTIQATLISVNPS